VRTKQEADSLGGAIKTARKSKGFTQARLADRLGISLRYLKSIENSGRKPSYDLLARTVQELDISTDTVFHLTERS